MWHIARRVNYAFKGFNLKNNLKRKHIQAIVIPLCSLTLYRYHCFSNDQVGGVERNLENRFTHDLKQTKLKKDEQQQVGIINKLISHFWHLVRFFHLIIIFIPPIVLLPLRMFQYTSQYWMDTFVKAIQRAGVVWIKALQYLSHRRDMIGPQMAQKFVHLRQKAPTHSFEQTKNNFKQAYKKQIHQIFQEFDQQPIASGSVSQVYKATYKGKKVAVKVRHPQVDKYIQRDINLLFTFSRFCSYFSKSFQIPVSQSSLKQTLTQQIDFNHQKDNLNIFNKMFEGRKDVKFPIAINEETRQSVLVQTFVQGVPITYYEENPHPLNAVIARIGAKAFFQMLMKFNFIHADCHGGNILVQIKESSETLLTQTWSYMKQFYYYLEQIFVQSTFNNDLLRKLYAESRRQQAQVRKLLRKCRQKVQVTLIDVGMVIRLEDIDRENFINFIKSVVQGNGNKCAQLIYSLSNFDGKKLIGGSFSDYLHDLKNLFQPISDNDLDHLQGIQLFTGMLDLIRQYQMKLDGEFATLLTNMLVLQAIAKQLNPNINILKCAVPYFAYSTL